MNSRKFAISEIVIALFAALLILFGVFYNSIVGLFANYADPFSLTDSDVGKTLTFKCTDEFLFADENAYVFPYENEEEIVSIYVKTPSSLYNEFYKKCRRSIGTYKGVLKRADESIKNTAFTSMDSYYIEISEYYDFFEYSPEIKEAAKDSISDYYIEVISIDNSVSKAPQHLAYTLAVILIATLIIRLIAFLTGTSAIKVAVIPVGIILVVAMVIGVVAFNKIRTIASVNKEGYGIYTITCYEDLKIDSLLAANVSTSDDLINWVIKEQLYGLPIEVDEENFGCATFVCANPEGETLMGRNFDYSETDTIVIYNEPENGYASYALADLTIVGVGEYGLDPDSLMGRAHMLVTPYVCLDGVNEAGLSVGILELDIDELHQDNGNPDILIYTAIRALLDKCANVDEAITLLNKYDVHTAIGYSYHLQIADKTGRAVVVEWLDGQMIVNELNCATNSVLTPGEHFDEGDPDERILTITNTLESNNNILTSEEARDLLEAVSQGELTQWSCVYNLDRFEVDVYMDTDYSKSYTFGN